MKIKKIKRFLFLVGVGYFALYLSGCSVVDGEGIELGLLESEDVAFSATMVGVVSYQEVILKNNSIADVSNVALKGANEIFYLKGEIFPGEGGSCGEIIRAKSECSLMLAFKPNAEGEITHSLTLEFNSVDINGATDGINSNALNLSSTINVSGMGGDGVADPAQLSISPVSPYDFGIQDISALNEQIFVISNSGDMEATVMAFSSFSGPFQYKGGTFPGDGGDCEDSLSKDETCSIVITYSSGSVGLHSDNLTLNYNDGEASQSLVLALSGQSKGKALLAYDGTPPYDFNIVVLGQSQEAVLTIINNGTDVALSMSSALSGEFVYKGDDYPGLGGNCEETMAAGDSCDLVVIFTPSANTAFNKNLEIGYFDQEVTKSVVFTLKGKGYDRPSGITLIDPLVSPNNDTTPRFRVDGVESGMTVNLYSNSSCSSSVLASGSATGTHIELTSSALTSGSYTIYANAIDSHGNASPCSSVHAIYDLDNDPPSDPSGWSLSLDTDDPDNGSTSYDYQPEISGTGILDADGGMASVYSDASCSTLEGQAVVSAGSFVINSIVFSNGGSEDGLKEFYGQLSDSLGNSTGCVNLSLSYTLDTVVEAPSDVLLSSLWVDNLSSTPQISWTPSSDPFVTSYKVGLSTAVAGGDAELAFQDVGNVSSETLSGLSLSAQCTPFYVSVLAVSSSGEESSYAVSSSAFQADATDPGAPTGLSESIAGGLNESNYLNWTASSDNCEISHYEFALGESAGVDDTLAWKNIGNVLGHQETGLSLDPATDYFTSVRAVDKAGRISSIASFGPWQVIIAADSISDLGYSGKSKSSISISWTMPNDNGSSITDYSIYYKESSSGTWLLFNDGVSTNTSEEITGLASSTSYDFKVFSYNGKNSLESNIVTAETAVDDPFFDPNSYKAFNIGGATTSRVVAYHDTTVITLNDSALVTLNKGETHGFTSSLNDVISADKPIFVAGRLGSGSDGNKGNVVWGVPSWAGKKFLFSASRGAPHKVNFHAFEVATISIYNGGTLVESKVVAEGGDATFSISLYGGFEVVSTGLVIGYMYSTVMQDPKPLFPTATEIIGFPSSTLKISPESAGTTYTGIHSNSTDISGSLTVGVATSINPQGTSSLYRSESLLITANNNVIGNSYADSNGICSAPFMPVAYMRKSYALNVEAEWVAFASKQAGTITMRDPSDGSTATVTLTRSGTNVNAPYKARVTNKSGGFIFSSTVPFAAWYEPKTDTNGADNDETIMFGTND